MKEPSLRFDVYGRFVVEVIKEGEVWAAYRVELGKRRRESALVFPADMEADAFATYIDDIFHEFAAPGENVRLLT